MFCVPALVLASLSLLRDACQRRNLASWLGVYGLVTEWVVTGCVHLPPPTLSLLATAFAVFSLFCVPE